MITVSLPVPKEKVPETLKTLQGEILRLETEQKMIEVLIEAVQETCEHDKRYYSVQGDPSCDCRICGKSFY
jgi:hypothetical protein